MKGSWPKVTASLRFDCEATHAMTRLGGDCAKSHSHRYEITFGWTHEIQPRDGYTHERLEQHSKLIKIIQQIQGANLNDLLPMQPSAEVLALWTLAQTALSSGLVVELLHTADSMSWSYAARKQGRNANDWKEAKRFAERIDSMPLQFPLLVMLAA